MRAKCERCSMHRSRLHACVTCGKRLCGCCSFKSRAGRVCCYPGNDTCHKAALAKFELTPRPPAATL